MESSEDAVRVNTGTKEARAQYDANVAFANAYASRCGAPTPGRKRVLLTGFGRFMNIADNATGRIVSAVVPQARYPETSPPRAGEVDPPAPQLSVGRATLHLPKSGDVDVCAMILPVYWDLAAILIAKEVQAFQPSFVLMNGVAGGTQPLWFEMGSINRGAALDDGSGNLRPAPKAGEATAKLVETAGADELGRPLLASWQAIRAAARDEIEKQGNVRGGGVAFKDVVEGAVFAGFPRESNTYLCNNVTYVTNYLLDHPGKSVTLLRASTRVAGKPSSVSVKLTGDYRKVPREFIHWPSTVVDGHVAPAKEVMLRILDAQIAALGTDDAPVRGDNDLADPSLRGGDTF